MVVVFRSNISDFMDILRKMTKMYFQNIIVMGGKGVVEKSEQTQKSQNDLILKVIFFLNMRKTKIPNIF